MFNEKTTQDIHLWMKGLPDDQKMRFALNWRLPHSLFNVAHAMRGDDPELQAVNWYEIHKTRDLGTWSHGGPVIVQGGF